jgi:UTP--glucose-1-phosphate uridylyltransferase
MKITKLVLPVAGLGTRLRPLTLTTPKNLIPVAGRPLLEYALEEAIPAGVKDVVLVVGPEHLAQYDAYLNSARRKYPQFNFYVRIQEDPWGNGHAVLQAADVVGNQPFLVRFCDDVIIGGRPAQKTLADIFNRHQAAAAALLARDPDVSRYGVIGGTLVDQNPRIYRIEKCVEKPGPEEAPSDLIVVGGYAFVPEAMAKLARFARSMRREKDSLLVNEPILEFIAEGKTVLGWEFDGKRLDCGTLAGLKFAEEYLGKTLNSKLQTSNPKP